MTRKDFIGSAAAAVAFGAGSVLAESAETDRYAASQAAIDRVTPEIFAKYLCADVRQPTGQPALDALDAAFETVLKGVRETVVTDRPAVWLVYNMGIVVKTPSCCFSVDLKHRRATELAPCLDFAMISHNHDDHYTEAFYRAMNGAGKTVISNFRDNYAAHRSKGGLGGYTRARKTFRIRDVEVTTMLTDHNAYLIDFTTAFEIKVGDFVIFHSGDCCNVNKLTPACASPDLWIVHPRCGMKVAEGAERLNPKTTVIAHLNELGHARDRWRWSWSDGLVEKAKVEATGRRAVVPLWGDRIA